MIPTSGERFVQAQPFAAAGGRVIVSPFQFYLDGADNIRIEAWNSLTGAVVQIYGRFYKDDGTIGIFEASVPLTADRVRNVRDFPAARGYMLTLVATVIGATPLLGQTFARVSVIRGFTGATIIVGTLLQGYLTSALGLAWPGSPIQQSHEIAGYMRSYEATIPSVGSAINEFVPTGAHWHIFAIQFRLLTDATVAVRNPYLQVNNDNGDPFCKVFTVGTASASMSRTFYMAELIPDTLTQPTNDTTTVLPHLELLGGWQVIIWTDIADAGDEFFTTPIFMLRERLEV